MSPPKHKNKQIKKKSPSAMRRKQRRAAQRAGNNTHVQRTSQLPLMLTNEVRVTPQHEICRYSGSDPLGYETSSINYSVTTYSVTPINGLIFPWLSTIAKGFQEYRFTKLRFRYVTSVGAAGNSSLPAMGSVYLGFNYDANDPQPASGIDIESLEGTVTFPPYANAELVIDLKKSSRPYEWLMMSTQGEVSPNDNRLEYTGRFTDATEGQQTSGVNIGKLYVDYDVEFRRQKLPSGGDFGTPIHYYAGNVTAGNALGSSGGVWNSATFYYGTVIPSAGGVTQLGTTSRMYIEKPGRYHIVAYWTGFATFTSVTATPGGGASSFSYLMNWTQSAMSFTSLGGTSALYTMGFVSAGMGSRIDFNITCTGTGVVDFFLYPVPTGSDLNVPLGANRLFIEKGERKEEGESCAIEPLTTSAESKLELEDVIDESDDERILVLKRQLRALRK